MALQPIFILLVAIEIAFLILIPVGQLCLMCDVIWMSDRWRHRGDQAKASGGYACACWAPRYCYVYLLDKSKALGPLAKANNVSF